MNLRAYICELLGTFSLALAVFISINQPAFPIPTPAIAALTLGLFVYTVGSISGTHINPAVTISLATIGKIGGIDCVCYLISQFLGASAASLVGRSYFPSPVVLQVANTAGVGFAEALGTFFLAFGVTSVVLGKIPNGFSGIVIGWSLLLGISLAAHTSNGVLNPAVAFGIGSFSPSYIWGPILGAVIGAQLRQWLEPSANERA